MRSGWFVPTGWRGARISVAWWLASMTLLAMAPALVFAVWATLRLAQERERDQLDDLQRRAGVIASVAGREIEHARSTLAALQAMFADLRAAGGGGGTEAEAALQRLHAFAGALVERDGRLASISAVRRDGTRVFHSGEPWGAPLPPSAIADSERPVFDTGRSVLAPLSIGAISGVPVIALAGPLDGDPRGRLSLRVALRQEALTRALLDLRTPAPLRASVVDQLGRVVAGTPDGPRRFADGDAADVAAAVVAAGGAASGVLPAVNRAGESVWMAVAPVSGTGWWAIAGVPREAVSAAASRPVRNLVIVGLMFAAWGAAGAYALGRYLTRRLREVAAGEAPTQLPLEELHGIQARMRETEAEASRARHDPLTGLPARDLLLRQIEDRLAAAADSPPLQLALLFIDLDGFKQLNDRHGHAAGDKALTEVAARLRAIVRGEDVAGRLGGDEFVVALLAPRGRVEALAAEVAERIRAGVRESGLMLDATVGIALSAPGETLEALIQRADVAMLRGKQDGRGRVVHA